MSDLKIIKSRLISEYKIEALLESLGCSYIKSEGSKLITAQLPDRFHSTNRRATQVKLNDSLTCAIRNKADFKGDVFDLISYIEFDKRGDEMLKNLHVSKEYICKLFGWTEFLKGGDFKARIDYVAPLRALLRNEQRQKEIVPNPVIPEEVLDEFLPYPAYDWIQEGISYNTQKMYGISFCLESKRIIIPMRNRFGQLVGVKGRIMKDEDDDKKYLYLHRYQNRYEWFNFHYAHPYILMDKRVYIFEAEKSCMKAFENGIFNTIAIGASEISPEQAQIVKQIGLDVEIVLCYDKGITLDEIRKGADIFVGRKVYALYDSDNLLGKKNSPIDDGIEIWNELIEDYMFEIKPEIVS